MNRFHKGSSESFLSCLPKDEVQEILSLELSGQELAPALAQPIEKIVKIHYTWLAPLIQKMPNEIQPVLISSLPQFMADGLNAAYKMDNKPIELIGPVKNFILQKIWENLPGARKVLPMEYLPQTQLTALAQMNKQELVEFVDLLGIHDLADEIRQIVDKRILKNVYACLTAKEQSYLRFCLYNKDRIASPSLGLDKWSGSCEKLKTVLQSRGLIRLGKALSGEHPDFIWHLIHIFDSGRGQRLLKHYSKKALPGVTMVLSQHVINLMNFIKKKSEP